MSIIHDITFLYNNKSSKKIHIHDHCSERCWIFQYHLKTANTLAFAFEKNYSSSESPSLE